MEVPSPVFPVCFSCLNSLGRVRLPVRERSSRKTRLRALTSDLYHPADRAVRLEFSDQSDDCPIQQRMDSLLRAVAPEGQLRQINGEGIPDESTLFLSTDFFGRAQWLDDIRRVSAYTACSRAEEQRQRSRWQPQRWLGNIQTID